MKFPVRKEISIFLCPMVLLIGNILYARSTGQPPARELIASLPLPDPFIINGSVLTGMASDVACDPYYRSSNRKGREISGYSGIFIPGKGPLDIQGNRQILQTDRRAESTPGKYCVIMPPGNENTPTASGGGVLSHSKALNSTRPAATTVRLPIRGWNTEIIRVNKKVYS